MDQKGSAQKRKVMIKAKAEYVKTPTCAGLATMQGCNVAMNGHNFMMFGEPVLVRDSLGTLTRVSRYSFICTKCGMTLEVEVNQELP